MEINKTILSKLSDSEIYNYLLNEISYVYDKYRYLSISSEVIDKIIYDEIIIKIMIIIRIILKIELKQELLLQVVKFLMMEN